MRLLVVGAGATGGYFGGRLVQAGRDVTFLVRPRRAEQIGERGLQITSPHGDVTLAPKLVTADRIDGPYDAVLLAVKAYSLDAAIADFAAAIGPETMIMPVLNGMRHMDVLDARFGRNAVVGGVCKVATTIGPEGQIIQLADFQELAYGERDGTTSPRTEALDALMQGAGFTARLTRAINYEMWEKWTLLATIGAITCLMRGNIGQVVAAPGGSTFILGLFDEVISVVSTVGEAPRPAFVENIRKSLTTPGSPQSPSMYRDLQQGSPIEGDQIVGDLLARGAEAGLATPLLATAYAHLVVYQNRIAAQ
ncbi:MAG TPA: 2-dehydropantoate 2-reductase [Stellaceae bacterium]|nr:2-dehydropantoate 2-reductase [Stellaceae bacterium]